MFEIDEFTLPAFKYLVAESDGICRLCFSATNIDDNGVFLDDRRLIQCHYYDDTVSYADMLRDLGATSEPALPQMLCEYCADTTISSFLFQKLCHQSHNKWNQLIEKLEKTIQPTDTFGPIVKSAYMFVMNDNNLILTSRKPQANKNKAAAITKIKDLMKVRKRRERNQKPQKTSRKHFLICEECGKEAKTKHNLRLHMRTHSKIKHPCKRCAKLFSTKEQLHAHLERVHKPKTIPCPKCPEMVSSVKMLKLHDSTHHMPATCKKCLMEFPSKLKLKQHSDIHNMNICPRCNKEIKTKKSFKYHLNVCGIDPENQINYFCDICDQGYAHKNGLRSHIKVKHGYGPVHRCDWCDKAFDAISRLKNHIVKHTRERNFHCDKCGGKFVTMHALIYHVRTHTGEKPFPCDLCDESFLSASRRMEHKRRKHWGPSRECPYCHSKFVTGHELRKHIMRHTNPQSRLYMSKSIE